MKARREAKEKQTPVYKVGNKMMMAFLFFLLVMNALAVIIIAPWIFVVTTAFGLVMYVILSLAFLIFFGVPFFEYKLISGYIRGESNDKGKEGKNGQPERGADGTGGASAAEKANNR